VQPIKPRKARALARPGVQVALLGFGLIVVVALVADLSHMPVKHKTVDEGITSDLQEMVLGMKGARYVDPSGRFSIVPPAGWRIVRPPDCTPYHVTFLGPNSCDLNIMVTPVAYTELPQLVKDIERTENRASIATDKESFFFKSIPAIRRHASLHRQKVIAIDFLANGMAHHILCGIPQELYARYEPILMDVINTYEPGKATP
jgi:hypothetical protein